MTRYVVISVAVLATMLYAASTRWPSLDHADGSELIGHPAPTLQLKDWVNSTRLEMQDLKGKVVLLRWWTDTCDLCAATAPALRKLQAEFGDRGFTVIGIFHPKPPGDHDLERVGRAVAKYNFTFPVALDADWTALRRWWLSGVDRDYTSVSFLIDKKGIIRYIQPGGEYHQGGPDSHLLCRRDFKDIETLVGRLTGED